MIKAVALAAALTLGATNIGLAAGGSIGFGDISVYKNNQLVSKLSGQNPVEDGSLLVCNGKCMIKSQGISLVGEDAAKVAVVSEEDNFKIYVKEGKVDFIINSNVRNVSFRTPGGIYTVAEVVFNAGSNPVVKGNIMVDERGETEINVTEGRLVFATAEGQKVVDANNKIVFAVAPTTTGAATAAGTGAATAAGTVGGMVTLGVTAGTIGLTAAGSANNGDNPPITDGGGTGDASNNF